MAKTLTLEQAAKVFLWTILSAILLFLGPRYADGLIFDPHATNRMRLTGVAISVASVIPWITYVAWGVTVADEYHRRTLLIGTSLAFVYAVLFSMTMQLLADAHLVGEVITIDIRIGFGLWFLGIATSALYHKVRGG